MTPHQQCSCGTRRWKLSCRPESFRADWCSRALCCALRSAASSSTRSAAECVKSSSCVCSALCPSWRCSFRPSQAHLSGFSARSSCSRWVSDMTNCRRLDGPANTGVDLRMNSLRLEHLRHAVARSGAAIFPPRGSARRSGSFDCRRTSWLCWARAARTTSRATSSSAAVVLCCLYQCYVA